MDITDFKIESGGVDEKIVSFKSKNKGMASFSMQGRGKSMMRLTQEVTKWRNNSILKILTV